MRRLIVLIVVVGLGIVFLQPISFSDEGRDVTPKNTEKASTVPGQKNTGKAEPNQDDAPSIVFEKLNHEFKTVYSGEKAVHLFKFENRGTGDLVIKKVKTSCGCTAAASTKGNIPPGGFGEIKATFRAGQSGGKVKKTITVTTNDPVKPKVSLTITANVVREIITKPQWINFGNISKGETGTKTIELSPGTGLNLDVTGVESNSPYVTASYKKHENGKNYIIEATTKSNAPIGRIKGRLTVTNNSTKQKKLFIAFSGKITGDVIVSRAVLSYGIIPQGRESMRKLIVTLRKKDIEIKDVEVTPAFLSINLRPKNNPNLPYREVEVRVKNDAPVGKIKGNIKIHTSSKLQPVIDIPVFGEIRKRKTKKS